MTYLVFIDTQNGGERHSVWSSHVDCKHQVDVLRGYGYRAWWEFVPAMLCVQNGHYFI